MTHDVLIDRAGTGHAFSHDSGACVVHTWDCMSRLLRIGYVDTGIRADDSGQYADHSDPDSIPTADDIAEMHAHVENAANERDEDLRHVAFDADMRNAGMWLDRAYTENVTEYAAMARRVAENTRDYAQTHAERMEVDSLIGEANTAFGLV